MTPWERPCSSWANMLPPGRTSSRALPLRPDAAAGADAPPRRGAWGGVPGRSGPHAVVSGLSGPGGAAESGGAGPGPGARPSSESGVRPGSGRPTCITAAGRYQRCRRRPSALLTLATARRGFRSWWGWEPSGGARHWRCRARARLAWRRCARAWGLGHGDWTLGQPSCRAPSPRRRGRRPGRRGAAPAGRGPGPVGGQRAG